MSRIFISTSVATMLLYSLPILAQPHLASTNGCRLIGGDSLAAGTMATYSLVGCKTGNWQISCGVINANTDSTATVYFDSAGCSNSTITAVTGSQTVARLTVKLVQPRAFDGGSIAAGDQAIGWNKFPALLTASAARHGVCNGDYSYQWYESTDNQHFVPIPGATGQHYQPGPVDSVTYFRRMTNCGTASAYTASVAIRPNAPLRAGRITPAAQAVNYHDQPSGLSMPGIGGGNGSFTYQWQSTTAWDDRSWQPVSGANDTTYTPGLLDTTTFFRLVLISDGDSLYSLRTVVSVYPMLSIRSVGPASQTITPGSIAPVLSAGDATGGNGAYTFQWYASSDGQSWTMLDQAQGQDYSPGPMNATAWYRVVVTSNGVSVTSTPSILQVTTVTPVNQ